MKKKKILLFGTIIVIVLVVFNFFFGITKIKGFNMENTYKEGQRVFVLKKAKLKPGSICIIKSKKLEYNSVRIIAVPGDEVEIKEDIVYVNGKELKENYIKEAMHFGDMKKIKLKPDKYFCMSDNRNNSLDSRYKSIGCIDKKNIKGTILFPFILVRPAGPFPLRM